MRIYNKFRQGTENLRVTALVGDRSWGVKLEKAEILEMIKAYLKKLHPGTRIEILNIATRSDDMPKCPNCNEEIDSVLYTGYGLYVWNGKEWEEDERAGGVEFRCPECLCQIQNPDAEEMGVL